MSIERYTQALGHCGSWQGLVMAAYFASDYEAGVCLHEAFPELIDELLQRLNIPGGALKTDPTLP